MTGSGVGFRLTPTVPDGAGILCDAEDFGAGVDVAKERIGVAQVEEDGGVVGAGVGSGCGVMGRIPGSVPGDCDVEGGWQGECDVRRAGSGYGHVHDSGADCERQDRPADGQD